MQILSAVCKHSSSSYPTSVQEGDELSISSCKYESSLLCICCGSGVYTHLLSLILLEYETKWNKNQLLQNRF